MGSMPCYLEARGDWPWYSLAFIFPISFNKERVLEVQCVSTGMYYGIWENWKYVCVATEQIQKRAVIEEVGKP